MANDLEKEAAARAALSYVKDSLIVGLGSGSTAAYFVRYLGERVKAGLKVQCVPTSNATKELAESLGIPLVSLENFPQLDIDIDGCDEFDLQLNLIKGGGGALLREKIIASAAREFVVIADSSKKVSELGKFPLPVEVISFAQPLLARKIKALGATVKLRKYAHGNPFVTDEGHHILDCHFGTISDPASLAQALSDMPGVVEHGLFINMATVVLMGKDGEVEEVRRA